MSTPIQSPSSHSSASSAPSTASLLLDATGLADVKADSQQSGSANAFVNLVEASDIKASDFETAEAKISYSSLSDKALKEGGGEIDDVLLQTLNALPAEVTSDEVSLNLSSLAIALPHTNRAGHGGEGGQLKAIASPSKNLAPQANHLDPSLVSDGASSSNQELPRIARGDLRAGLDVLAQGALGSKPVTAALSTNAVKGNVTTTAEDLSLTSAQVQQQAQVRQQLQTASLPSQVIDEAVPSASAASIIKAVGAVKSTDSLEGVDNVSQVLERSSELNAKPTNDYKHPHLLDIRPNDQVNRVLDSDVNRLPSSQSNLMQASQVIMDNGGVTLTSGGTSLAGLPASSGVAIATSSAQINTTPSPTAYAQVMSTESGYIINSDELALTITQIKDRGHNSLRIKLDPQELGRIDVRLDMANDGLSKIVLNVDRPETFDLLNREGRELQRTLEQLGVKFGEHGVKITLGDSNQGRSDQGGQGDARGAEDFVSADEDEQQKDDRQSAESDNQDIDRLYATLRPNGLDIRL